MVFIIVFQGDRVQSIVSRTSQDFIQVVLYDNEGGQLAMAAGDRLNQDLQQGEHLGAESI